MRYLFITGVSRGLGRAIAKQALTDETKIVGFGRTKGDFEGTFHSCDFTKPQLASAIFEVALKAEPIEGASEIAFISNAGVLGQIAQAPDLDAFDIERTIAANLCGTAVAASCFVARATEIAVPKVFAQISSGAALSHKAKASWSLYCSSKAGQEQFVRSVAAEQTDKPHPIKFVNINPGVMETQMQEQIRGVPSSVFPDVDKFINLSKEGKVPTPETIAQRICALLKNIGSLESGKTYDVS